MAYTLLRDLLWDKAFVPSQLATREGLADELNTLGLVGQAVEIGTHIGEYAEAFLDRWQGQGLTCVDPWQTGLEHYTDYPNRIREPDYEEAQRRLARFNSRVRFIRSLSRDATPQFADASLDFIFVDGNHAQEYVREDFSLWWPKLKPGGMFAGHDFISYGHGIQLPLLELYATVGAPILIIPMPADTWYMMKPND